MPHKTNKWVIVFLIYADFRKNVKDSQADFLLMTKQMKAELNSLFKDILTVPIDEQLARMYVVINSIDYKEKLETETEAKTLLYRIGNPNKQRFNQIMSCDVISNRPGTNDCPNPGSPIQNPQFLKDKILNQNRISVHRDEEVFFITWDHGSAFGIFREVEAAVAEMRTPIYHDLDQYPYMSIFWSKAIENDSHLKKMTKASHDRKTSSVVQICHSLFKVVPSVSNNKFRQYLSKVDQNTIPITRTESFNTTSRLRLFFDKTGNNFEVTNRKNVLSSPNNLIVDTGELRVENVREILSNDELAEVFTNWLGAKKVAVLLMMNCWMMNLHTMFSLRDSVKCLVAPQGNIGTPGYNYKEILRYLFGPNGCFQGPVELAIQCVTTIETTRMRKRSKRLREDNEDVIDKWKIFAVDLERTDKNGSILINHLNRLNKIFKLLKPHNQRGDESIALYQSMRLVCQDFTKVGTNGEEAFIVDIIVWLRILFDLRRRKHLGRTFPVNIGTLNLANLLIDDIQSNSSLKQLVLKETDGVKIYDTDSAIIKFDPTGYGLFFPNSITDSQNLIDNVKKDSLLDVELFEWKEFIKSVYSKNIWKPFF